MYKKDKQGMIVVLIALTLFLAISIGFKFQSAVVALSIALTVILVQSLSSTFNSFRTTVFSAENPTLFYSHTTHSHLCGCFSCISCLYQSLDVDCWWGITGFIVMFDSNY